MQKHTAILAAALVLPAIAGITWMLIPSPQPLPEDAPRAEVRDAASTTADMPAASPGSRATVIAGTISRPGITRPAEDYFPETTPAPAPAPVVELTARPEILVSPRYTLTTQPNAATLAAGLKYQPPLQRDERIRVLPAEAASAENRPAAANGAVVLVLDSTLHDPAAWLEDTKPGSSAHADVKAKIADEFTAEVAAAAKQPETAGKNLDGTWQNARAKANWEYQKFFGTEAANRAGMNAGRAAVAK